ncbi:hypothetical protein, partial [Vibrio vulnificus]|uniref:hypothetical protein n=1 Tax=Vibrio vulnificus TaxID=672 RepID=UPI003ED8B108
DGKEVKLTLTGYFWRYGIRKAIQVSIFRMNPPSIKALAIAANNPEKKPLASVLGSVFEKLSYL